MGKRERENPCEVCGHYHKYEEGEVCGICGHRKLPTPEKPSPSAHFSAFPSEILPQFLYLGSYDNASRSELLNTLRISRILNTVPACHNLHKNSFTYHCLQDDKSLPFDEANQFLEQCERDKARVLVHCMSGKSRSPAFVIAYLMRSKGWRLGQSHRWVKERRLSVDLTEAVYQQLQEYEKQLFVSMDGPDPSPIVFTSPEAQPFSFGFPKTENQVLMPAFNSVASTSIFSRPNFDIPPQEYTFGAGLSQSNITSHSSNSSSNVQMDST